MNGPRENPLKINYEIVKNFSDDYRQLMNNLKHMQERISILNENFSTMKSFFLSKYFHSNEVNNPGEGGRALEICLGVRRVHLWQKQKTHKKLIFL